ncbi:MAG: hypothetical protein M1812_004908 [Candelaria pacifica]|nr:MAG: hypothetical protein M1812_004908 [Candelaria pacifica]
MSSNTPSDNLMDNSLSSLSLNSSPSPQYDRGRNRAGSMSMLNHFLDPSDTGSSSFKQRAPPQSPPTPHLTGPFRLLDLPLELQRPVLEHALVTNDPILPYHHDVSGKALLHVSHHISHEASLILYGKNEYMLVTATEAYRFLRSIGPINISKFRSIALSIGTGAMSATSTPEEQLWLPALHLLHQNHQLRQISITFVFWDCLFADWGTQSMDANWYSTRAIMSARRAVTRVLKLFVGGVREVEIEGFPALPWKLAEFIQGVDNLGFVEEGVE